MLKYIGYSVISLGDFAFCFWSIVEESVCYKNCRYFPTVLFKRLTKCIFFVFLINKYILSIKRLLQPQNKLNANDCLIQNRFIMSSHNTTRPISQLGPVAAQTYRSVYLSVTPWRFVYNLSKNCANIYLMLNFFLRVSQ
jgi:hypothetical protein